MPMLLLSFPGKKALRFEGDTSAAERDADLAVLMHAGKKAKPRRRWSWAIWVSHNRMSVI